VIGSVHDVVPTIYQGLPHFLNATHTQFHDTHPVYVISFTVPNTVSVTFTTPTNAYNNSVQICYLGVTPDWTINVEITVRNSVTPPKILWLSQRRIRRNVHLLDAITMGNSILTGTQTEQEMWEVQSQSHACLITPTRCTIFIHYIHLSYFSSMFCCHSHHNRGELLRHLTNTTSCYEAIIYSYYSRPVIYKGDDFFFLNFVLPCIIV